jgi:hypothetical protein
MSSNAIEKQSAEAQTGMKAKSGNQLQSVTLLGATLKMEDALQMLEQINIKANFIALNAAIEAARSQSQTENFALVADQVSRQAQRTEELAYKLKTEIRDLQMCALKATAVRFADISSDIIDKVDRNLFERNCDCQAWATFESVQACATATLGITPETLKLPKFSDLGTATNPMHQAIKKCSDQLTSLAQTYQVYTDVFVINSHGVIVAAAKRQNLIGKYQGDQEYFQTAIKTKAVHVSEMHVSSLTKAMAVSYTAPILDSSGKPIGVVTTSFNWDFAQEIIDKMPLDKDVRAFLISRDGTVLASRGGRNVLKDNLSWLCSGEEAMAGGSGYTIESARNGRPTAWGYCHTRGFNAYAGKGWSAIVCHPVDLNSLKFIHEPIQRDGVSHLKASELANKQLVILSENVRELVRTINYINNETNMLAVNASIQAGVAGADGESFSVIASEIGKLAKQSEDFVSVVNSLTEALGTCVQSTVAVRLGDAAFDTIDKIDRNLFERYCDVQAFSAFRQVIECCKEPSLAADCQDLLKKAHTIYEVYHDIFVLDVKGTVICSALRSDLVGTSQADRDWFRDCLRGSVVVTDLYFSRTINDYTVTFAAPVRDQSGTLVGVVSTRFDCKFMHGIMTAAIVGDESRVYLLNSKGLMIGGTTNDGMLERSFMQLKSFKQAEVSQSGYLMEVTPSDGVENAIGFARNPGYNNYKGKGWTILVIRPTGRASDSGNSTNGVVISMREEK